MYMYMVGEPYQSISLLIFYHSCRVLISTVNKSTDALPLVFFNNCFADEDFNNGSYVDRGSIEIMVAMNELYNHVQSVACMEK